VFGANCAAADVVGGLTAVVGGACVVVGGAWVVVGGAWVVVGGACVVVGCVVVVVLGCVVVVVVVWVVVLVVDGVVDSLLVVDGAGALDDGGGVTTVGLPSVPVTVMVSVRGTPGDWGFVTAGDVAGLERFVPMGPLPLVSVNTSPPVASRTAINAAENTTEGRRYHGSGSSAAGSGALGGTNSICGRALVGSGS
jgi:hypothetical protein